MFAAAAAAKRIVETPGPGIEFPAFKEVTLGDVKHELVRKAG
jgi:hypothetical protein